jgi:hypothetical protein
VSDFSRFEIVIGDAKTGYKPFEHSLKAFFPLQKILHGFCSTSLRFSVASLFRRFAFPSLRFSVASLIRR